MISPRRSSSETHDGPTREAMIHCCQNRQVALTLLRRVGPRQETRYADDLAARRTALDAVQLDVVLLQQTGRELVLALLDLRPCLLVNRVGKGRELVQGSERKTDDAPRVQTLSVRALWTMLASVKEVTQTVLEV